MPTIYSVYTALLFTSLILAVLLLGLLQKYRQNATSRSILWLTVVAIGVEASMLLALYSPDAAWARWWHGNVRLAIYTVIPPAGFLFVRAFITHNKVADRRIWWIFLIPLITGTASLTNDWHHWYFTQYSMQRQEIYLRTAWQPAGLYWVQAVYSYILGVTILWWLGIWLRRPAILPRLRGVLMVSVAVLLIGAISLDTFGFMVAPGMLLLPVSLGFIAIIFILGIWYLDLLDILPVARETLIRYMSDMVFIVDAQNIVLEVNTVVEKQLGLPAAEIIGKNILQFIFREDRVKLADEILDGEFHGVMPLAGHGTDRYFDILVTGIYLENQSLAAKLVVLRDVTDLKQAQESLYESEKRYRLLAENIIDVIWILDLETQRFRYVSPSVERLRGYTPEEVMAADMTASLTPDSLAKLVQGLPSELARFLGGEWVGEYHVDQVEQPCKDGTTVWTETTTRFMHNPDSGHIEVYGVSRDISERKRAQDALRLSEERYRLLADKAPMAVAVIDLETSRVVYANQRASDLFAIPAEQAIGTLAGDYYVDSQERDELIRLLHANNSVVDFETQLKTGTGRVFWASITSNLSIFEGRPAIHSVYIDITARKQAEEALRESELTARTLLKLPTISILLLTPDGTIVDCNETLAQRLGVPTKDLIGKQPWLFLADEVTGIRKRYFVESVDSGQAVRWEDSRAGHWFDNIYLPMTDRDGKVTKILACGYDITARKLAEAEQSQRAALEERQRLARDLHDAVSQTLFSARLTSEMLLRQQETIQPEVLWEDIAHLASLVRSALGEMRILLLELRPEGLEKASLATLLSHLVDALEGRTEAKIHYEVTGQGDLPAKVKTAFYRIAQEALNNVLKHAHCENIFVRFTFGPPLVQLTVADDGQGLEISENKGTQLGLNIMRERASEIGALFTITSSPGDGTCVTCAWQPEGNPNGN